MSKNNSHNSYANTIRPKHLPQAILLGWEAGIPIYIEGPPGMGKSQIIQQTAKMEGKELIDIRLSQMDAVDLMGVPFPKDGVTDWNPPSFFKKIQDNPGRYALFMDEFDKASPAVQNASLQILLDKQIGSIDLSGCVMVLAGNRIEDKAGSNRISTAARNRVISLTLEHNIEDTLDYWIKANFHPHVIAYIRFRTQGLNEMVMRGSSKEEYERIAIVKNSPAFATPRSWEAVSRLLHNGLSKQQDMITPMLAGTVGTVEGTTFAAFVKHEDECPSFEEIVKKPHSAKLPKNPAAKHIVATTVGEKMNPTNISACIEYLDRLDKEFQVISIRDANKRGPEIARTKDFMKWMGDNKTVLL